MKGYDKLVLITDAMRACLMEEGVYDLGGQKVIVKDKAARLTNGALAGSVLTMNDAIRNFIHNQGSAVQDAVRMASWNPARILSIEGKKGSIEVGKDADLVLLDEDFEVFETIVKGKTVCKK
jgi:N-acetylglucosamine-6-phosphate deacetylase